MPDNKAEIEALIANSPSFQNAAKFTDELLGTNVQERANDHLEDLKEADQAEGRAKALKNFVPDNAPTAPKENEFEQPALKELITDPSPSARSKQVRDQALSAFQNIDSLVDHSKDWAKPMGFNTGANDVDYERYYYHPNFKTLGYSPFRDNESLYNANASWWDDFTRMRSQWMGLAGEGFKSMIEQWKNPLDFSPNTDMAKSFEKGMAIMSSSKPGFGAKFTNFVGNSGYTVGILADMVAEEAVLLGATALTGGTGTAVTGPGMVGAFARGIARMTKGTQYVDDIIKAQRAGQGIKEVIQGVNSATKARNIYETARKYGAAGVNFLNPLRNTAEFVRDVTREAKAAADIGKASKKLTNMAIAARGVGSFYKDVRMSNAAFAEARLEGGMVKNEQLKNWVGDYYNKHGELPKGEEAEKINEMATESGVADALMNIPMIYYTNSLVLGKAFRGWLPTPVARELEAGGKGVRFLKSKVGKKTVYEGVSGIKRFGKAAYWKQAPAIIAGDMLRYTSANFAEGSQESFQDLTATAVKDYYNAIYRSPALAGHRQGYASFGKGVGAQFTEQGAETFLSGFFMGALIQGPQNLLYTHGRTAAMAAGERIQTGVDEKGRPRYAVAPGTLAKLRKEKADWIAHVEKSLNAVAENPEAYAKALELNMTRQTSLADVMNQAVNDKDQKSFEDGKTESMFQHFYTLLNSGHFENFVTELESLRELKPEELAEAFNISDPAKAHDRLNKVISRAYEVKDHYDDINARFVDDTNPYLFDPVKEKTEFKNAQRRKVAFREAKMHAAFGDYAYNNALSRMTSIMEDAVSIHKPLAKAPSTSLSILFDPFRPDGQLSTEIKTLRKEASTLRGTTPANEARIPALRKKIDALVTLQKQMRHYADVFKLQRKGKTVPESVIAQSENAINDLHKAYRDYLKILSKETGEALLDKNIPSSFSGLVDFVELDQESKNMARFVNYLHNPDNFLKYVDQFDDELAKQLENWYQNNREALTKYIGRQDMNIFINIIFDKGAFVDPASIEDLAAKKYQDLNFVHATTGGPIEKTSDKYINDIKPIVDLFSDIETEAAPIAEEPVVEPTPEPEAPVVSEEAEPAPTGPLTEIPETEIVTEVQDTDEIKALREEAAAKTEDPDEKLEILLGRRDNILLPAAPAEPPLLEQLKQAQIELETARELGDEQAVLAHQATIRDLRGQLEKPAEVVEEVPLREQIDKTETLNELINLRTRVFKEAAQDVNYFKTFNASEFENLYNAKLDVLTNSVTFDNISKGNYLIMKNRKSFPTGVGIVQYKTSDYIKVRPITEDGTPDPFNTITVDKENLSKSVKNVYSEALEETVPTVDTQTEALSNESIKETKDMSTDEKKTVITKGKETDIEDLKKNLFKKRC